ncbi:hypothetical protein C8R48DRAFT_745952 [Suillus tomentosus]|nr:hypothetical protein C8R48DRAFT_745952 [Suillus tomentosus]
MFSTTPSSSGASDARPDLGVSHSFTHKISKPRQPKSGCNVSPSVFCPHVLFYDHIGLWSAPHSSSFHLALLDKLSPDPTLHLLDMLLVPPHCSFIAHWAGKVAATTAENWLAGLHFWNQFNNAPWHGGHLLHRSKFFQMSMPSPVTIEHMHTLFCNLDLLNSFDSAVYCMASIAFWCCCRLGELVVPLVNMFDPSRHIVRSSNVSHNMAANGVMFSVFHIPWMKTTHGEGVDIMATKVDDPTNPYNALVHHLSINSLVPSHVPFFTSEMHNGCNIWASAGLPLLTGHCFRIRGTTELLLCGTPPDISRAFLEYWHCIESILPLFITNSFNSSRISLVHSSMDSFCRNYS